MEEKTESFTLRLSARYKEYLRAMAGDAGLSAGSFMNYLIFRAFLEYVDVLAHEEAHRTALREAGLPETLTEKEADEVTKALGPEKRQRYLEGSLEIITDTVDRLRRKAGITDEELAALPRNIFIKPDEAKLRRYFRGKELSDNWQASKGE